MDILNDFITFFMSIALILIIIAICIKLMNIILIQILDFKKSINVGLEKMKAQKKFINLEISKYLNKIEPSIKDNTE